MPDYTFRGTRLRCPCCAAVLNELTIAMHTSAYSNRSWP